MSYRYRSDNIAPVLVIIILCFLVYIATEAGRHFFDYNLIALLGLQTATFVHAPWTIVTNLFVHADIWHILFNMITLYFFGTFLIRLVGTRDFLITYFLGGIVGNLIFMLFASLMYELNIDQELFYIPVVGASGAIFALGGALAMLTPRLRVFVFPIPVPMPLWAAVLGGFLILSFIPGVAWQGHLGGLLFGLLAGLVLRRRMRTPFS
jgi:membrane associated rhomboid family serine protease